MVLSQMILKHIDFIRLIDLDRLVLDRFFLVTNKKLVGAKIQKQLWYCMMIIYKKNIII